MAASLTSTSRTTTCLTTEGKRSGYLPSLDGWRAVAVLGVMASHDAAYTIDGVRLGAVQPFVGSGVLLFFGISGLLITTRILEEEAQHGRVDLKGFYVRRFLRIQPAAWVYLAVTAIAGLAGIVMDGGWHAWFAALACYRNYLPRNVGAFSYFATGHFWSLAVEEHFYLILSLLLFFVTKRRAALFGVLAAVAVVVPFMLVHFGLATAGGGTTQQCLGYLLWPAFLAVLLRRPRVRAWMTANLWPGTTMLLIVVLAMLWGLVAGNFRGVVGMPMIEDFLFFMCPLLPLATMLHAESWTTRVLELSPLRFVGRISYSLYLWHVIFFVGRFHGPAAGFDPRGVWCFRAPWNYLLAMGVATLSYYVIERPLMRLGHRLAPPASPGRMDLGDTAEVETHEPAICAPSVSAPVAGV